MSAHFQAMVVGTESSEPKHCPEAK